MTFLVPHAALHGRLAKDRTDRLAERLGAVNDEEDALLGVEAALDQVGEQRRRDGGVLGATTQQQPCSSSPSIIITANLTSSKRRLISSDSARFVRSVKERETDERHVDRAVCSTLVPTGSCVRR
jgi:hypothetical protein